MLIYFKANSHPSSGGLMNKAERTSWLSVLPITGYEIKVLLKTGQELCVPWGRISTDGKIVHIGIIFRQTGKNEFPAIKQTMQIVESDIKEITLKEFENLPEVRVIRRTASSSKIPDTEWLKDLPKSGECDIFLLCKDKDRLIGIKKGWIEYDASRIHLNEIISRKKDPGTGLDRIESVRHERNIDEVIAVLISCAGGPASVFVRSIKQKPNYKN